MAIASSRPSLGTPNDCLLDLSNDDIILIFSRVQLAFRQMLLTKDPDLVFERFDAPVALRQSNFDVRRLSALRNVLRTVREWFRGADGGLSSIARDRCRKLISDGKNDLRRKKFHA